MSPEVAVLLCAHNAKQFTREAVGSILNQTYQEY